MLSNCRTCGKRFFLANVTIYHEGFSVFALHFPFHYNLLSLVQSVWKTTVTEVEILRPIERRSNEIQFAYLWSCIFGTEPPMINGLPKARCTQEKQGNELINDGFSCVSGSTCESKERIYPFFNSLNWVQLADFYASFESMKIARMKTRKCLRCHELSASELNLICPTLSDRKNKQIFLVVRRNVCMSQQRRTAHIFLCLIFL